MPTRASDKIDLGVGVYRTEDGATPVFAAIKAAERSGWSTSRTARPISARKATWASSMR
jgi:aspartate/tyrosine/aromatic aminotransferase